MPPEPGHCSGTAISYPARRTRRVATAMASTAAAAPSTVQMRPAPACDAESATTRPDPARPAPASPASAQTPAATTAGAPLDHLPPRMLVARGQCLTREAPQTVRKLRELVGRRTDERHGRDLDDDEIEPACAQVEERRS